MVSALAAETPKLKLVMRLSPAQLSERRSNARDAGVRDFEDAGQ